MLKVLLVLGLQLYAAEVSLASSSSTSLPASLAAPEAPWPLEGKVAASASSGTPQRFFFMHARVQQWWLHATNLLDRGSEGWLEFDVLYAHAGQLELWEQYRAPESQGDAHVDRHSLLQAH